MKLIHCLIAGMVLSAIAADASADDHQRGIKQLIAAATASRHHRQQPAPSSGVSPDDKQGGIKKLIAAATASRHLRPVGSGRHAAKDASSTDDGPGDTVDALQDLGSSTDTTKSSAARKAQPAPNPGPAVAVAGGATGGVRPTNGSAAQAGTTPSAAANGAVGVGPAKASTNRIGSVPKDLSAVGGGPSLTSRGGINGTGMGRPIRAAIGGASITSKNVASLNGAAVHSKR
jgi:hypothetical protein